MPRTMRLPDVNDREIIALAYDIADSDGTFTTADMAAHFDLDSKYPLSNVGIRLGYLRKIELLGRDDVTKRWYLTAVGERYARGKLTAAQRRALESLHEEGAAWTATESLAAILGGASYTQAAMMRRQWQYGWSKRNTHAR